MKMRHALFFTALVVPLLLLAEEETHVEIGSRPVSEVAAPSEEALEEEAPLETAGFIFDNYPVVFYANSHSNHFVVAVTVLDNHKFTLELEDGSVWKISSYDGAKALNWRTNDPLTITQNNRWFAKHPYRIINQGNGTSVEASLYLGPVELGENSRFIVSIDHSRRKMLLSDSSHVANTTWEISYLDDSIFRNWELKDYIIIGTNSNTSIWDSSSDALLINVNMNNCLRAKQVLPVEDLW